MELVLFQSSELTKSHFHDCLCLNVIEIEASLQVLNGFLRTLGSTDNVYHFIDIVAGNNQAFQNVGTLFCLALVELGTTNRYIMAMIHEILDALLQRKQLWTTRVVGTSTNQCNTVHTEARLEVSHLVELVQHHISIGIALQVNHDTHTFAVRLIVYIRDAIDFLISDKFCNLLDELRLVHIVRNLVNNNLIVSSFRFDVCLRTNDDTSTTCLVCFLHSIQTADNTASWEVRSFDVFHQTFCGDFRVVNHGNASINHFAQVMRRDIGCHTHGNTRSTIHQQVWYASWQHLWLFQRTIEVVFKINCLFVEVIHHCLTQASESSLCVTHGSCTITIHRTEVSLSIYQAITHCPVLSQAHQCTIH